MLLASHFYTTVAFKEEYKQYMWQSRVEIEHYSIGDFDRVTMFEAL